MRRFVMPVLALLGVYAYAAAAQAAVYTCNAKSVEHVGSDGIPAAPETGAPQPFARFTFDDRTGRVDSGNDTRVLSLLQKAVGPNALLAVGIQKGVGNTALQVLKIDAATGDEMPFVWIDDARISIGLCTRD